MHCTNCGTQLPELVMSCPNCGAPVQRISDPDRRNLCNLSNLPVPEGMERLPEHGNFSGCQIRTLLQENL